MFITCDNLYVLYNFGSFIVLIYIVTIFLVYILSIHCTKMFLCQIYIIYPILPSSMLSLFSSWFVHFTILFVFLFL